MSDLQQAVAQVLRPEGLFSQCLPDFQPRQAQQDMADAVSQTIATGGQLVVEAGTGVGKTYAYLVPTLLSGQRALISTATKALQDQLFARDIPRLLEWLGLPLRVALLKGRGSYLCLHRMEQAPHGFALDAPGMRHTWQRVEQWSRLTRTGDLGELTGLDEQSAVLPLVTSTRDNCLGSMCPKYKSCHVNLARKEAMAADLVVINHHLFFADMAVRESGVAELLPNVGITVFDEAHQLNQIGVHFLGSHISSSQLLELARDALASALQWAKGLADWQALAGRLETAVRDWRLSAGHRRNAVRLRWTEAAPEGLEAGDWTRAVQTVDEALLSLHKALETVEELSPDLARLRERCDQGREKLAAFAEPVQLGHVRWLEVSAQLRMMDSPLDIAQAFGDWVKPAVQGQARSKEMPESAGALSPVLPATRAWIFTSATLGDDPQLSWFTEPCGLQQARCMQVGSPFDYERQAGLFVPPDMVRPQDPRHSEQVARWAEQGARALRGRTLVLTTTLSAMRTIGDVLRTHLADDPELEVLVQGEWPKRKLMERFRQAIEQGDKGLVLVGSASFWEGFDVPGEALQLVVIDKLPFPPPGDPLVQARSERLQEQGKSPFADHALPEAAVALKQGAGRLIRSELDRGLLVIGDPRLVQMSYGKRLLRALPPMRRLEDAQAFDAALQQITRTSTTSSWS